MFGLFKRGGAEPVEIEASIEIEASAERVFALLDFASPGNRLKERGFVFAEAAGGLGRYEASDPSMPGCAFVFDVEAREAPRRLEVVSRIVADIKFGALEESRSVYAVATSGAGACRVDLVETATFAPGLKGRALGQETAMLTLAVHNDLARLKIHAEQGLDAALACEDDLVVPLGDEIEIGFVD